jgi:hypothetical protein
VIALFWLAVALAQDPDVEPEEVIVYGQLAIDQARDALLREMEGLGWRAVEKPDGRILFKSRESWQGKATFDPSMGSLDFRKPMVGVQAAPAGDPSGRVPPPSIPDPGGMPYPAQQSNGAGVFVAPSASKVDKVWAAVRAQTNDELQAYQAVVYETALQERLQQVPEQLDALWRQGTPMSPGPVVPEGEARLAAILDFWASRAPTTEGQRICKAVEAWLAAEVPEIPEAQAQRAEAARLHGRKLPR